MPQCWVVCVGVARHANAGGIIEDVGERIKIRVMIWASGRVILLTISVASGMVQPSTSAASVVIWFRSSLFESPCARCVVYHATRTATGGTPASGGRSRIVTDTEACGGRQGCRMAVMAPTISDPNAAASGACSSI